MLKALIVALCALALGLPVTATVAQDFSPFVIVPDNPPGGIGGGGNAVTTSALNVRAGPGTRYPVVDVLRQGESVRINLCEGGWCWINHRGPSGWVSENHLRRTGGGGGGGGGSDVVVRPLRGACFYEQPNLRGLSFCAVPGENNANLGAWNNRIRSIEVRGFNTVQVCSGRNFQDCDAFNLDVRHLPWWLDRNISSFRVFH